MYNSAKMQHIIPPKLKTGDEIRVIAPARSLSMISESVRQISSQRLEALGFKISFGKNVEESDAFISSSVASRISDLHDAFSDPQIKAVMTVIGGFNSNQLLDGIDWDLIQANPKILIGYSDITALQNAIFAKTGLMTYSGPHYSTFGQLKQFEYTLEYFKKCIMNDSPFEITPSPTWSDDEWYLDQEHRIPLSNEGHWLINAGAATGCLVGANLCTFNLLQGTNYFPDLRDTVLFLEDDYESQPHHFDRDLQSLIQQSGFTEVKGIVIGRFQKKSQMTRELLTQIIMTKDALRSMPIIANVDFGHTQSMITFPIGGEVELLASKDETKITITKH